MNVYYYSDNGTQRGPVSFDDLKSVGIQKNTLVWRDGLDDWQEAGEIPELDGLFNESPNSSDTKKDNEWGYDPASQVISDIDNSKMFKNAFLFKGRARRLEFWISYAIIFACMMLITLFADVLGDSIFFGVLSFILMLGGLWLIFSEGCRRCHDLGHSGFWLFIPYYVLWMLFQNSKEGPNEYGSNPKQKH